MLRWSLRQQPQDLELHVRGVLELVDEHVVEAAGDARANRLVAREQLPQLELHAAEVERGGVVQEQLVLLVEAGLFEQQFGLLAVVGVDGVGQGGLGVLAQVVRSAALFFQPVDLLEHLADHLRRVAAQRQPVERQLVHAREHDRHAVGAGGGGEERIQTGRRRLVAQQVHAQRVEGGGVGLFDVLAEHLLDSLAQLGRGVLGVGQREDALDRHAAAHQPLEARGQRLGLAAAGAGHDQQRPAEMRDGLVLRLVQLGEALFESGVVRRAAAGHGLLLRMRIRAHSL